MYLKVVLVALSCAVLAKAGRPFSDTKQSQYYSTFTGQPLSDDQLQRIKQQNLKYCAIEVAPCDPTEGRRLDATCNNLRHPSRGGIQTPYYRILPPIYGENFEPRLAKSGKPLPLARHVRNSLLVGGKVPHEDFTQLFTHFLVFLMADVSVTTDTDNFVFNKTYCCEPKGKNDNECTPNKVKNDDPYFRYSDIRCLNMTRPHSFQHYGCLPKKTTPERANLGSPLMDMGIIYGETPTGVNKVRTFKGGLLITDEENGMIWPPSTKTQDNVCILNQGPSETRCHNTPDYRMNTVLGSSIFGIWFWRMHNKIATELAQLNPGWDDDKLFYTARDINMAISLQIFHYELMPLWMGRDNLLASGLIQESTGFRDIYDDRLYPRVSIESTYVFRWTHLMQNSDLKLYEPNGYFMKKVPTGNLTLRTGFLPLDNNFLGITHGSYRQPCGASDNIVDTDLLTLALGDLQRAFDLLTNDISKSRYFGLQGYVKYREYCTGKTYKTFDDLTDVIPRKWVDVLSDVYEDINDVELMAGLWVEDMMPGAQVPPTLYCLGVPQLVKNIKSDRHWYERPNRPHAFTYEQLQEIRKASIARLLCDVGDSVTKIQPAAFLRPRSGNQITSCKNIPKINWKVWKDDSCSA